MGGEQNIYVVGFIQIESALNQLATDASSTL